jgi:predicted TPR repeat methyltransferase
MNNVTTYSCRCNIYDSEGFALHSKVRFAHSLGYIRELSRKHHFAEVHVREITVRKEGAQDVAGWLVVPRVKRHD